MKSETVKYSRKIKAQNKRN